MTDAPKIWAAECSATNSTMWWPDDAGGVGTEYTRTDVDAQAALEKVKREARNEALREAAEAFEVEDDHVLKLARNAIIALMEDTNDGNI